MRILVVEQHDKLSIGVVGETLRDLGAELQVMWGAFGDTLPGTHQGYDGIIVLGGAMTALDDELCPYFPPLTRLIRDFAEADKPVLGICLGSQLIARSFDADLHLGGNIEFGFHQMTPTAAAADDPVFDHLDGPISLFQWHTDHYALPAGSVRLITAERYENQAYRIGRTVYAMQFHFEVTESVVQNWIEETPDLDERVPGYRDWLPAQFAAHEEASNAFCRTVTRRWAALA